MPDLKDTMIYMIAVRGEDKLRMAQWCGLLDTFVDVNEGVGFKKAQVESWG